MMDHDNVEKKSLQKNGFKPILCIFHFMSTIMNRIRKVEKKHWSKLFYLIKVRVLINNVTFFTLKGNSTIWQR